MLISAEWVMVSASGSDSVYSLHAANKGFSLLTEQILYQHDLFLLSLTISLSLSTVPPAGFVTNSSLRLMTNQK